PHSEIGRSSRACRSLPRIAAWHVLLRHTAPRHSPEALTSFRTRLHSRSRLPPRNRRHTCTSKSASKIAPKTTKEPQRLLLNTLLRRTKHTRTRTRGGTELRQGTHAYLRYSPCART